MEHLRNLNAVSVSPSVKIYYIHVKIDTLMEQFA